MNNRFVFIMPTYNAEHTIARSIMSVWMQTHSNWRILIRDDMSTDNTADIIESLKDNFGLGNDKILLEQNKEKKWKVRNIVELLDKCSSDDIVCRLDGDDWVEIS